MNLDKSRVPSKLPEVYEVVRPGESLRILRRGDVVIVRGRYPIGANRLTVFFIGAALGILLGAFVDALFLW